MPLDILIVGAGVAGPALAVLLQNSNQGHNITVIERSSSLRASGQQIDIKGKGVPIIRKMSLLDAIREHGVAEKGMDFVNSKGQLVARFGVEDQAKGEFAMSLTSQYEIMRGDLVKVFHDASVRQAAQKAAGSLKYEFGKTVEGLTQSDGKVEVTFSGGQKKRYDLVVGADGQNSRIRRLAFGAQADDDAFKSMDTHVAFYSIPRRADEDGDFAKCYMAPGRRGIMTRTGDRAVTQVYLLAMHRTEDMKALKGRTVQEQKEIWAGVFKNAGWEADRFLEGLKTCSDFYTCEIAQIKLSRLYTGRVLLLGDAGYSPTVLTGQGTTVSLIGAYILAGELARNGNNVGAALQAYEDSMQPVISECQKMPSGSSLLWPSSKLAIWTTQLMMRMMVTFKIDQLIGRLFLGGKDQKTDAWTLPEYPELDQVYG